jgi:signal transduction histidine kinase
MAEGETVELRQTLRDLLGLLALPAGWRGRDTSQILLTFSEALEATVDADVILVSPAPSDDPAVVVRMRRADAHERAADIHGWFAPLAATTASTTMRLPCGPLGALSVVCEPIGYYAALGRVIVASRNPAFPSPAELALIRAATALTASTLETARAMQEREEALRAREDFMAVLGHELRNPLAPIASALAIIRNRQGGRLSREEQVIERQVEHLTRLVDDLLDIARITRGTIELKEARVELTDIIDQAVEESAGLFERRGHSLRVDVPRTGLVVDGDRFRLLQVLVNLLTNAARYTPEGGHIELVAIVHDGRVRVSVRDDGIGMAPDLLARVFDPFVQGRRSSDPQYGGLGVGLALVRTLVKLHHGFTSARSEGKGQGSQFDVDLPLAAPLAPAAGAPERRAAVEAAPATAVTRSRRILVVDDNVDSAEMLGEVLKMAGHEVRILHDPFVATDAARTLVAEVVVLDLGMPGRDGYEVASDIQAHFGMTSPALIALTGYGQDSDRAKTTAAGFAAHFVKPVNLADLVARVGSI